MSIDHHEVAALAAQLHQVDVDPGAHRAVNDVAGDVVAFAQAAAPVLTGALAGSISADVDGLTITAGTAIRYGRYVEEGTSDTAPQPFMGPALDRGIGQLERALGDAGYDALR